MQTQRNTVSVSAAAAHVDPASGPGVGAAAAAQARGTRAVRFERVAAAHSGSAPGGAAAFATARRHRPQTAGARDAEGRRALTGSALVVAVLCLAMGFLAARAATAAAADEGAAAVWSAEDAPRVEEWAARGGVPLGTLAGGAEGPPVTGDARPPRAGGR